MLVRIPGTTLAREAGQALWLPGNDFHAPLGAPLERLPVRFLSVGIKLGSAR